VIKNAKAKGRRNEYRSIRLLESAGYCCTRAAASLGVFDIVGIGSTDFILCQVKTRVWPSRKEMEDIYSFRCPPNCRKIVHRWHDWQKLPDVKECK